MPDLETAITVCWPTDQIQAAAVIENGPVVYSACHECGRGVIANVSDISHLAGRGIVAIPLCEPCAMSPHWRAILRSMDMEFSPDMSVSDINAMMARLRETDDGFSIN